MPSTKTPVEEAILALLDDRGPEKTTCPSEVARALADGRDFRPYTEPVREAADRLARAGRVAIRIEGAAEHVLDKVPGLSTARAEERAEVVARETGTDRPPPI